MQRKPQLGQHTLLATLICLSLTACGGSSSSSNDNDTPDTPANSAPTNVTLSNSSIQEKLIGQQVGTLTATDADTNDSHTFTTESTLFTIDGNRVSLAEGVMLFNGDNFEGDSVDLTITVDDGNGGVADFTLPITIADYPNLYEFPSHFNAQSSSVSYTGQTARHVLIAELNYYITNQLQADIDSEVLTDKAAVIAKLNSWFEPDDAAGYDDLPILFTENSDALISDISSYKSLKEKIAGNDATGQHKDWNTAGNFLGWEDDTTPEGLVAILFDRLAENAEVRISGAERLDPLGEVINSIYVDEDGVDLAQMIQKFLLMAVPYSQATDDYFGIDTDGKGLTTSNVGAAKEGASYTNLEHQYDEGFGYFGAARNYLDYTDVEIAGKVTDTEGRSDWNMQHDTDMDGSINLRSEYNFGQAVNAAKRDLGTADNANPTDYTMQAMTNFLAGRQLINDNVGAELTTAQFDQLVMYTKAGVDAWERAIAATVVHYINDTYNDLAHLATGGTPADFNYADLAKHYSEMKGFGLGLQFNEYKQVDDTTFASFHQLIGNAPVLTGDVDGYREQLLEARDLLETAYGFDAENVQNW